MNGRPRSGCCRCRSRALSLGARRALRNRPDSEHELTINRLVLAGLTLIYLVIASSFDDASAVSMLHKAGFLITLYYTCSIALFAWLSAVSLEHRCRAG